MAFRGGSKAVAAAGTAEPLTATRQVYCSLTIQAKSGNTGTVYVGDSNVSSSNYFFELQGYPDSITLLSSEGDSINTAQVFIDAANNDDAVTFGGIAR